MYMSVVLEKAFLNTTKLPCSSPILLGSFESFALQNIQASFNNVVTNINVCTKGRTIIFLEGGDEKY